MKIFKKISLALLSVMFVLSGGLLIKGIVPEKKVDAATSAYKYLYLSDLPNPTAVAVENGNAFAINQTMNPGDVKNGAITLKIGGGLCEQEFSKAVTFNRGDGNTVGGVKYNIAGLGATRFTATIGMNIITGAWGMGVNSKAGQAAFRVYGDDRILYDSAKTISYEMQAEYVDVDVTGVNTLYLAAYDLDGNVDIMSEHCVYANPKLYGENLVNGVEANYLYLSEFPISYIDYQDYYLNGTETVAINYGLPYNGILYPPLQLRVNGARKNYTKGISVQANAKFGYDISSTNAYRLTATIGLQQRDNMDINESSSDRGSVVFKVNYRWNGGNDQNLYTSGVFYRNTNAIDIDIKIPYGASHVSFIVEDGGDGINFDNATWADLKLYCDSVNLSDMTVTDYEVGDGSLLLDQVQEGKPTLNNYINENGTLHQQQIEFDKCVFMHDPSYVVYDVRNMNVYRFTAFVGIVSTKLPTYTDGWVQPVTYKLYKGVGGDGKSGTTWTLLDTAVYEMIRTDQMKKIDYNNMPTDMDFFKIEAYPTNGDKNSGHAVVCMPRFYGNNVFGTKSVSLSPANDSLVSGETAGVKLYATSFNNVVTEKTDFTLSSSNSSVFSVNNTNKTFTANSTGEGSVNVSYVENGREYTTFFNAVSGTANGSNAYAQLVVKSPDGKTKIIITRHNGWIDYSATKDGKMIVEKSRMGIDTSLGALKMDFGSANVSLGTQKTINETYDVYSGKYAQNVNYCNENTITFTHTSGVKVTIVARAYNDGVAFRYQINNGSSSFVVYDEQTSVTIPGLSKFWSMPMPSGSGKSYTHEQYASEQVISSYNGAKTIPLMYKTPDGQYVLLTEADMDKNYNGVVAWSEGEKTLRLGESEQQVNDITVSGGYLETPWRAFIAGSLEEVIKSVMVENLADAPDLEALRAKWGAGYEDYDFSWVDPGVSSWSWMSGLNGYQGGGWFAPTGGAGYQGNPEAIKNYIDLAAEMGWEYFILDEGWQPFVVNSSVTWGNIDLPGTYWDDTEPVGTWQNFPNWYFGVYDFMIDTDTNPALEKYVAQVDTVTYTRGTYTGTPIMEYAKQKGVKLVAWLHTGICDTPARMEKVFSMLHDIGIAGIKIDFFDSETTETMAMYDQLYELTAKYELLGIFHGSNKPSGERRTWPHVLNREAVNGEENNNTKVYQHTISGYVRGTVGPTDLTPYIYTVGKGDTNMVAQMAFSIIYESGLTCFASTADEYRALSTDVKYYYQNFPGSWTDLKLISGEVGEKMSIARKAPNNRWYIGCISTEATTDNVSLSFLGSGNYTAYIYTDKADNRQAVTCTKQTVTSASTLTLSSSQADGGYVVVLEPEHTHAATGSTWSNDASNHWQVCSCGQKLNTAGHTYVQETTPSAANKATNATCQAAATYYKVCSVCKRVSTTETYSYGSVAGHNYVQETTPSEANKATNATCQAAATYYKVCSVCGAKGSETYSYGSVAGHNYVQETTPSEANKATSATCQAAATYYKVCSVCGIKGSETYSYGSVGQHNFGGDYISDGNTGHHQVCQTSGCGASSATQGHTYVQEATPSEENKATNATCQVAATYYKLCEHCGHKGTETYSYGSVGQHNFGGDYISDGEAGHHQTCQTPGCGEASGVEGHDYNGDTICDNCGYNNYVAPPAISTQTPSTSSKVDEMLSSETSSTTTSSQVSSTTTTQTPSSSSARQENISSNRGGCGGSIGASSIILSVMSLASIALIKKAKKKD